MDPNKDSNHKKNERRRKDRKTPCRFLPTYLRINSAAHGLFTASKISNRSISSRLEHRRRNFHHCPDSTVEIIRILIDVCLNFRRFWDWIVVIRHDFKMTANGLSHILKSLFHTRSCGNATG